MTGSRIDANHSEIRDGLRQAGRVVIDASQWVTRNRPSPGFDLIVFYQGRATFMEVKMVGENLSPTESVVKSIIDANGGKYVKYAVVYSLEEALERTE